MKIHCAVIFINTQPAISAPIKSGFWQTNSYEKKIQNYFPEIYQSIQDQIGIHILSLQGSTYYALVFKEKIAVLALDEKISEHQSLGLYENIAKVNHSQHLHDLIMTPEKALQSRTDKMKQELDETVMILHQTIDKLTERGEKIGNLLTKTEELANNTIEFKRKTKEMNRSCPYLFPIFSIYNSISERIWGEPKYEYHEVKSTKP